MATKGVLLRYIHSNGGLFTENSLLKLRDNLNQVDLGKFESFGIFETKVQKQDINTKRQFVFDWCVEKWDEIAIEVDNFNEEDISIKWLCPLLEELDFNLSPFSEFKDEDIDEDSPLKGFKVSYQQETDKILCFQFVKPYDDLDSLILTNPQRKSHHDICQQFVNMHPEIHWLILSNGRFLRIITKYYYSYSKGYLEFDLENIFANRDVQEFNLFYSLLHASRFQSAGDGEDLLIEKFQKDSIKEGVKIGDALRDNVHDALELLGDELLQQNSFLLLTAKNGELYFQQYYSELLRIIYRMFFILYAEQRNMLPGAGSIYFDQFSLSSLRILAEKPIKKDNNCDIWKRLFLTFKLVKEGNNFLDIPCYDGKLFDDDLLPLVKGNNLKVSNEIILKVVKLLTTTAGNNIRQRINFLEISEEEIGAIYESLLEFKPCFTAGNQFHLSYTTSDRKSTGSYYTPKELIDILIKTSLHPLVIERLKKIKDAKEEREKVILDIKICDPACGGGTFLLSALDYLGEELAEIRTDLKNPPENDLRTARRDVLQHCIYGVDKNPLAVELAKISLWLRACVKDKPLCYLDNHIKCGNSLIGFGQKQDIKYVNPDAFVAITGNKETGIESENKVLATKAKKMIKKEIDELQKGGKITRLSSFLVEKKTADICSLEFQKVIDMPEDDPALIKKKEMRYSELKKYSQYQQALNEANIYTSAFFWSFEGDSLGSIPNMRLISELRENVINPLEDHLVKKINEIALNNQFFHWYIEFPEAFSEKRKGFDCILTNPPWDILLLKEMEFFSNISEDVQNTATQAERREEIKKLMNNNPKLYNEYRNEWKRLKKIDNFLRTSNNYPLTSVGTINLYAIFAERVLSLISESGRAGIITPTGIVMNFHLKGYFNALIQQNKLVSLFDFKNERKLFDIDSRTHFCLLTIGKNEKSGQKIPMAFYAIEPDQIQREISHIEENIGDISDSQLTFFDNNDFKLLNPNTLTCPIFKSKKDAEITKRIYNENQILIKRDPSTEEIQENPWNIDFKSLFHMSNDSALFLTQIDLEKLGAKPINDKTIGGIWEDDKEKKIYYPLYDGKMIWIYDHRYNSVEYAGDGKKRKSVSRETYDDEHDDPFFSAIPLFWVEFDNIKDRITEYDRKWFIAYRNITNPVTERSFIVSVIPYSAVGNSMPLIMSKMTPNDLLLLIANLSSLCFDYLVRQKLSGTNMNFYILEQMPIISVDRYSDPVRELISKLVLELIYTSNDLKDFASDCNCYSEPFKWDSEKREMNKATLDAIYFLLYGINREELEHIFENFDQLERYEIEKYKEFKTKRLVITQYETVLKEKELF